MYVIDTQLNPSLGLFSATIHYSKKVKCLTVREWDILCLFSGCVECNVTLPGLGKALTAVGVDVLPVAARGQGKGLTLPFQPETPVDFYSFSFSVLKA